MDLMDAANSLLGGGGDNSGDILSTVMGLVGGKDGLNGLINQFTSKGLGDVIGSWVGTGNNLPISAEQIQSVLGSDTVKNLASQIGMDSSTLSSQLANLLPGVVDKMTPEGKVPDNDVLSQGMNMLGGLFGK